MRLLTLSVDAQDDARRLAKGEGLDFPILCDTKREVIAAYGLRHEAGGLDGGDIPIPALLLIDKDGRILARHVSERAQDRWAPRRILATVRQAIN